LYSKVVFITLPHDEFFVNIIIGRDIYKYPKKNKTHILSKIGHTKAEKQKRERKNK